MASARTRQDTTGKTRKIKWRGRKTELYILYTKPFHNTRKPVIDQAETDSVSSLFVCWPNLEIQKMDWSFFLFSTVADFKRYHYRTIWKLKCVSSVVIRVHWGFQVSKSVLSRQSVLRPLTKWLPRSTVSCQSCAVKSYPAIVRSCGFRCSPDVISFLVEQMSFRW